MRSSGSGARLQAGLTQAPAAQASISPNSFSPSSSTGVPGRFCRVPGAAGDPRSGTALWVSGITGTNWSCPSIPALPGVRPALAHQMSRLARKPQLVLYRPRGLPIRSFDHRGKRNEVVPRRAAAYRGATSFTSGQASRNALVNKSSQIRKQTLSQQSRFLRRINACAGMLCWVRVWSTSLFFERSANCSGAADN